MIGMHGTVSAAWAVERCDLLVCIGARFSDRVATNTNAFCTVGEGHRTLTLTTAEINKNIGVDYAIVSDAETFLEKVTAVYARRQSTTHGARRLPNGRQKLDYVPKDDDSVIHPHQLLRTVCGG